MRLAEVMAARVERAAQRADRTGIGGAGGRVLRLEMMLANAALDLLDVLPALLRLACDVELSISRPGDHRCGDEGDRECDKGREGFRQRAEHAVEGSDGGDGR